MHGPQTLRIGSGSGTSTYPAPVNYESTATADQIAARLKLAGSATVLTHAKPDGDAVGSTLAVARTLMAQGARAEIRYAGPVPAWLRTLAGTTPWSEIAPGSHSTGQIPSPDSIVIVDTGSWNQLAESRALIEQFPDRVVLIDHHVAGNADVAPLRLIEKAAASATEVLTPVCCAVLGVASPSLLPLDVAQALYLGLATDTGWFRFSSVSPNTLRLAADLKEAGVNHTDLYRLIEQQDTISRWRLLGRSLSSVQLHDVGHPAGKLAIGLLNLEDFAQTGADHNDTGGFADMVLAVQEVAASAVLVQQDVVPGQPPVTKLSIRCKPGANGTGPFFNAATITARLGGGGHVLAAGAKINAGLEESVQRLLEAARLS